MARITWRGTNKENSWQYEAKSRSKITLQPVHAFMRMTRQIGIFRFSIQFWIEALVSFRFEENGLLFRGVWAHCFEEFRTFEVCGGPLVSLDFFFFFFFGITSTKSIGYNSYLHSVCRYEGYRNPIVHRLTVSWSAIPRSYQSRHQTSGPKLVVIPQTCRK